MSRHARVTWVETDRPWLPETQAIEQLSVPLNLQGNSQHPYYPLLKALRAEHRTMARASYRVTPLPPNGDFLNCTPAPAQKRQLGI